MYTSTGGAVPRDKSLIEIYFLALQGNSSIDVSRPFIVKYSEILQCSVTAKLRTLDVAIHLKSEMPLKEQLSASCCCGCWQSVSSLMSSNDVWSQDVSSEAGKSSLVTTTLTFVTVSKIEESLKPEVWRRSASDEGKEQLFKKFGKCISYTLG